MSFFSELKRRNVFRVGIAYAVAAWLLVQIADVMIDNIGAPDWLFSGLLLALALGFPIALLLAWAFELTPEGIKPEAEVDRDSPAAGTTGGGLNRGIIALLVVVVAWFLFDEFYLEPQEQQGHAASQAQLSSNDESTDTSPGSADKSVAVLPFRVMSSGPDDNYFADGLTEEILNSLAQVPALAVTSRTSSFFFKDKDLPIGQIAEELGVAHVVEGSIRRSGDQLRVTAQLIRASDDTHLWSENYDRSGADAIAVQEDIALRIAEALGVFLDEDTMQSMRTAGLRDVTAFIEYQKGRALHEEAHQLENMMPMLAEGNVHLETALEIQPGFSKGWLFLSDYYTHLLLDNATGLVVPELSDEASSEALAAGRQAIANAARNAASAGARAASELDLAIYEGDSTAWQPLLKPLLASNGCEDIIWAQLVSFVPEYAMSFARRSRELLACDPLTKRYAGMVLSSYLWGGQAAKALEEASFDEAKMHAFQVKWSIMIHVALGNFDEAARMNAIDSSNDQTRMQMEYLLAAAQGQSDQARQIKALIESRTSDNRFDALLRAAWLGDRDRANELAALIDSKPLGHLSLLMSTYWCACGAPFDLEATPNFARVWADSGFEWPLQSPINFPLKDW